MKPQHQTVGVLNGPIRDTRHPRTAVGLRPHGTSVVLDHLHGRKVLGWARFGGQDDDSDVLA
jgi:hypothetical protein